MNLGELYNDLIREHSMSGHNKRHLEKADVVEPGKNPSCGDEINLELLINGDKVEDAAFTGVGCAISQASASMMIDLIRGKSLEEAKELSRIFLNMIRRETLSGEELERLDEAISLQNIANMPARVKCATMPWHTLERAVADLGK